MSPVDCCYSCSVTESCLTLCSPMNCSTPGFSVHPSLSSRVCSNSLSIELVMPFNHLIFYCPLLLLPSIFSSIRIFSNESVLISFSFSISPSNKYSGLISFRIDWFDLLAIQGTLKSLLQDHSSKASILRHSAFFMVHFFTFLWCCA